MRILVTDGMDKGAIEKVRAMGHELVEQFYEPDELGKALRDFDVAIIRSRPSCAPSRSTRPRAAASSASSAPVSASTTSTCSTPRTTASR